MKNLRSLLLSLIFALSSVSLAFADAALPEDPIERMTNGALTTVGAIATVAIAGVLGYMYSKKKK